MLKFISYLIIIPLIFCSSDKDIEIFEFCPKHFSHIYTTHDNKPIYLKLTSERQINFQTEFSNMKNFNNSYKVVFSSIFITWNFITFLIAFLQIFIYREFHYVYLSLFLFLLTCFFLLHDNLLFADLLFVLKIKFLVLVFSAYFYTLFINRILEERKKNFYKLWNWIGIFILVSYFFSLFLSPQKMYQLWSFVFLVLICFSLVSIFSNKKKDVTSSVLLGISTFILVIEILVLYLLDNVIFDFYTTLYFAPNVLHFFFSTFILAFLILKAKANIRKKTELEESLKQMEKKLIENEKKVLQLEKLSQEEKSKLNFTKNEFIKQTVLTLKTPLFNIASISEVLLEDVEVIQNSYLSRDIKSILENAKSLTHVLRDLFDYSLLETGSIVLNKHPLDLKSVVDITIISMDSFLKARKVTFQNNIQDNLPLIDGDEDRIHQVFYSLFFKIIESSRENLVTISATLVPGYVKTKIKYFGSSIHFPNTSNSISLEWKDMEVNENFQNIINLAVISKLVRLHGGKVYSKQNEESTIVIFLPISKHQTKPNHQKPIKKKDWLEYYIYPSAFPNTFQFIENEQESILVIDDEIINLETLKSILIAYNYKPILVSTAEEGLKEIHKEKPSLVLVDLFMPGMDGYKFCQLVREIYDKNELPIILITSSSKWEEITVLFDLINDTIIKPFTKEKLISRVKSAINLAKMNQAYKRFVPPEFISLLNKKDISELKLGDHVQKRMTVLFSDLRNYTRISESMNPEDNFSFLNSYLGRIGPIIRKYNGFIDKYIGDAIMAIFPRNAEDAVQSAIEMQRSIHEFNLERIKKGEQTITAGIGIHTGEVILGTLGEEKRMEGTVISDAVNISSRLENLTKLYQASILITMETFLELEDQENYNFRILDKVKVKGKEQFITVVEIMDGYEEEKLSKLLQCKVYFEEGVSYYLRRDFETALEKFQKVIEVVPNDRATQIYIQRSKFYKEHGVPKDWDGVEILDEKIY